MALPTVKFFQYKTSSVLLRIICLLLPLLAFNKLFFGTNLLPKMDFWNSQISVAKLWVLMIRNDT